MKERKRQSWRRRDVETGADPEVGKEVKIEVLAEVEGVVDIEVETETEAEVGP